MELHEIVARYAAALPRIDAGDAEVRANPRTGEIYLPGIKTMPEPTAVREIDRWWAANRPEDQTLVGMAYPTLVRTRCDHVITTDGGQEPEWAIEVKNIALVGNNGKRNDFAVAKVLSPYLKDRSLLHDVLRLREYPLARRHAVVGYAFNYDATTCERALDLHPEHQAVVAEIRNVCVSNGGALRLKPLLDFADGILVVRTLVRGPRVESPFEAWRHPCGGEGLVFGWEVRRPDREEGFDPRHPW